MAFTMELNSFISGERFQALADISIIPEGNGNGEKNCGFVVQQQNNNNYNAFYYNNGEKINEYILNARILFVNTWTLDKFFNYIFPQLTGNYIFISHNSDMGINEEHRNFLDSNKVIGWYSQNAYINHPKLKALPIGLGNQQYAHGDLNLLKNIQNLNTPKDWLVFKQFSIDTNRNARAYVDIITQNNSLPMLPAMSQIDYFKNLARSAFCICPPGNGIDCHRIWESLYLKTIPIVFYHECFSQFRHLPILFIDDWNKVTIQFLREKYNLFKTLIEQPLPELDINYWKTKIYDNYK